MAFAKYVDPTVLSSLTSTWRRVAPLHSDTYGLEVLQAYYGLAAWTDNNTFESIGPKLAEQPALIPEFYNRFDYNWAMDSSSYEYPQDVLYQYFALLAAAGVWHTAPEATRHDSRFANIGTRTLYEWGLVGGAPRARPAVDNWQIIIFPYAWQEFSATALEAMLSTTQNPLAITDFQLGTTKIDIEQVRPFWDALLIKGLLGKASCHEILKPELAERLSKQMGTTPFLPAQSIGMRPIELLNEFSLRFSTAHEVGHHLSPIFDPDGDSHPELMADTLACLSLSAANWESLGSDYAPLVEQAKEVPIVAGSTFYFILALWLTTQNAVGRMTGEPNQTQAKRIDELSLRINNWRNTELKLGNPQSPHRGPDAFFQETLNHVVAFREYADTRISEMHTVALAHNEDLIRENPAAATPEGLEAWLAEHLGEDLPTTLKEALERLSGSYPKPKRDPS